jgi:hypothetical protein
MEIQTRISKITLTADRTVKCVFCPDLIPLADAMRKSGVCLLCSFEIAELGWRTVYDRDLAIGQIPENLRTAYKL